MASINFDATQVAPNKGFSAIEKGKYPVYITKSEFKPTANGGGKLLELHMIVNGGVRNGSDIMININWENANPTAEKIGHGQFSAFCWATGVLQPQDTQQLHNIMFDLEVDVTPDGKYNNYVSATPIQQQAPQAAPQVQAQPVYQQPAQPQYQPVQQYQPQPTPVVQVQQPVYQPQPQMQPQAPVVMQQPNPMAQYEQMATPQAQPMQQPAPQGQAPAVPDWIKNQQLAQAGAAPMGNA